MNFRTRFDELCRAKGKELGRKLAYNEVLDLGEAAHRECQKTAVRERERGGIHPDAEKVYELYPKKTGKEAALIEISKALQKHPLEYLLDKTAQFAACVQAWPSSYRYFQDGGDRVWNPVNFYRDGHHEDDPKEWKRQGSRGAPPPLKQNLKEPEGWRFAHPQSRFVIENTPWQSIDETSQRWIIANTPQQERTA